MVLRMTFVHGIPNVSFCHSRPFLIGMIQGSVPGGPARMEEQKRKTMVLPAKNRARNDRRGSCED